MFCTGEHFFFQTNYHTRICVDCGVEEDFWGKSSNVANTTYQQRNMPFNIAYSRKKRFVTMLNNLFFASLTHLDNRIVKCFVEHGEKFSSMCELFSFLKHVKCTDKRYMCVHGFAKCFLSNYSEIKPIPPKCIHSTIHTMAVFFEHIETTFIRLFPKTPFFNYNFLLHELLLFFDFPDYIVFVKKLKSHKRANVYNEMLLKINHDFLCKGAIARNSLLRFRQQLERP